MVRGLRKHVLLVAVMVSSIAAGVPSRAAPPNSQTQTWRFIGTPCSVTQSWSLQPSATIADRALVDASVSCADGEPAFSLLLRVDDVTDNSVVGIQRGGDPSEQFPLRGTGSVHITVERPRRHLYQSQVTLYFARRITGPLPCPVIGASIACTLTQYFMPLTNRPVATNAPQPTPILVDFSASPCYAEYSIVRTPPTGITLSVKGSCGPFTLSLYEDPQESILLTQVGTCYGCIPSATFLLAPKGRTFTVALRGYWSLGNYPTVYVSDDRNIVIAN